MLGACARCDTRIGRPRSTASVRCPVCAGLPGPPESGEEKPVGVCADMETCRSAPSCALGERIRGPRPGGPEAVARIVLPGRHRRTRAHAGTRRRKAQHTRQRGNHRQLRGATHSASIPLVGLQFPRAGPSLRRSCLDATTTPRRHQTPAGHSAHRGVLCGVHRGEHTAAQRGDRSEHHGEPVIAYAGRRILASTPRRVRWRRPRGSSLSPDRSPRSAARQQSGSGPSAVLAESHMLSRVVCRRASPVRQRTRDATSGDASPLGSGRCRRQLRDLLHDLTRPTASLGGDRVGGDRANGRGGEATCPWRRGKVPWPSSQVAWRLGKHHVGKCLWSPNFYSA